MYSKPVNNDAWYEPPEQDIMTDEEYEEQITEAYADDLILLECFMETITGSMLNSFRNSDDVAFMQEFRHHVAKAIAARVI